MALRDYWIVRVRKEDSEKFQTFYTTSKNKIQSMRDGGFSMKTICHFKAAVLTGMDLSPLPSAEFFEPVYKKK